MSERVSYTILYELGHYPVPVDKYYMVFWMKILGLYDYDLHNASNNQQFSNQSMTFNQFIKFINSYYHREDELTSPQVKQLQQLWYKNAGSSSISKSEFINSLDAFRGFFNELVYEKIIPLEDLTFIVNKLREQFRKNYEKQLSNIGAKKAVQKNRDEEDYTTMLINQRENGEKSMEMDIYGQWVEQQIIKRYLEGNGRTLGPNNLKWAKEKVEREGLTLPSKYDTASTSIPVPVPPLVFADEPVHDVLDEVMRRGAEDVERQRIEEPRRQADEDRFIAVLNAAERGENTYTGNPEQMRRDQLDRERLETLMGPPLPPDFLMKKSGGKKRKNRKTIKKRNRKTIKKRNRKTIKKRNRKTRNKK